MKILQPPVKDTDSLVIKNSKFIPLLFVVPTKEEVSAVLAELRKKYAGAVHFCYAYRLGNLGEEYRANDDGEPSGSAGLPILNQLLSFEVTQVLAVVIRYYGGVKLGVSGLIKAYKSSIHSALRIQDYDELIIKRKAKITFPQEESFKLYEWEKSMAYRIKEIYPTYGIIEFNDETSLKEKISQKIQETQGFNFTPLD